MVEGYHSWVAACPVGREAILRWARREPGADASFAMYGLASMATQVTCPDCIVCEVEYVLGRSGLL